MVEPKAPLTIHILRSFGDDFSQLPAEVRKKANEQIRRLGFGDFSHPSLRVKKMKGRSGIWEARITRGYRITFYKLKHAIILRRIGTHDILRSP